MGRKDHKKIKKINKNQLSTEEKENLFVEIKFMSKLDHPNIIKVYEFYQDYNCCYIVTELCTGSDLFDRIANTESFTEKEASYMMR